MHGYSVLLDQQQTIQKNGTTTVLTDPNGLPTLELNLASRARELDEKMCAHRRGGTQSNSKCVPRDLQTLGEYCVRGRGKESPHLSRCEQADDGIPVVQLDYALLHNTGDKDAKVTFFTMVDNSSGQMVATAVQKKGHDKFVERFLLKGLASLGVTGEMVLQTDKETGPIDVAKHVAGERKATTIIRQTPKNHERGDRRPSTH